MNILHISPLDPIPIHSGLRERIYQTSRFLGLNHNVRLIYPYEPARRKNSNEGRTPHVQPFDQDKLESKIGGILDKHIPHYSPFRGVYKTHPWLYSSIRRQINEFEPDVVIVEMPFLVPITMAACRNNDTSIILTEHNVQFKITERLGIPGTKPLRVFETTIANKVDTVVTVSNTDKKILSQYVPGDRIVVAPNGVDTDRYKPQTCKEIKRKYGEGSPIFIYHGSLGNAQNGEAVDILLEQIFPKLKKEYPDAKLLLIGSDPPDVDQPDVVTTGLVDDLPTYIAAADVAVVPLVSGSGTKLKILEYMSSKVPVVTTSVGAEGLPLEDGKHAAVEDEWDLFVQRAVELARNSEKSTNICENARKLVEDKFSWQATLEPYEKIIQNIPER